MLRVVEFIPYYNLPFIIGMGANHSAEDIHRSGWHKCMLGMPLTACYYGNNGKYARAIQVRGKLGGTSASTVFSTGLRLQL